jgi:Lon protease-like protein
VSLQAFDFSEPDPITDFDGVTRLFPLPNVVLFPGALLPLHIFEPRYRQMVADAVNSDRMITMVLLKPGYEADYEGCPEIYEIGCLGRIVQHQPMPDGRSNLLLRGICRVQIEAEGPSGRLYRTARVSMVADQYPAGWPAAAADWNQRIVNALTEVISLLGRAEDALRVAQAAGVPAGRLCDFAAHCLGFEVATKQALLEKLDVRRRAADLLAWMQAVARAARRLRDGGPGFSVN